MTSYFRLLIFTLTTVLLICVGQTNAATVVARDKASPDIVTRGGKIQRIITIDVTAGQADGVVCFNEEDANTEVDPESIVSGDNFSPVSKDAPDTIATRVPTETRIGRVISNFPWLDFIPVLISGNNRISKGG